MTVSGRKSLNGKTGVESTRDRECRLWRVSAALDKASQAWPTKAHSGAIHHSKTRFLARRPHIWLLFGGTQLPPGRPAPSPGRRVVSRWGGEGSLSLDTGGRSGVLWHLADPPPSSHRLGLFMSPGKLAETRPDIKVPAASEEEARAWECKLRPPLAAGRGRFSPGWWQAGPRPRPPLSPVLPRPLLI